MVQYATIQYASRYFYQDTICVCMHNIMIHSCKETVYLCYISVITENTMSAETQCSDKIVIVETSDVSNKFDSIGCHHDYITHE